METERYRSDDLVVRSMRVRATNTEKRSVDVIASTNTEDAYGEIVEQTWNLDQYRQNPVVLYAHNSRELPIGRSNNVRVENDQLTASLQFATADANPRAEQVWQLIKQGVLSAVSVGFNPRDVRMEMRDGRDVFVLSNNDLYEISVVPIPANPDAMIRMRQRAAGSKRAAPAAPNPEAKSMKTILTELGLTETEGEEEVLKIVRSLRSRVANHDEVLEAIAMTGCTDGEQVLSVIKAYKEQSELVPGLEARIKSLIEDAERIQRDSLVEKILTAKKATPHQRDHYLPTLSIKDLRLFLETAPRINALAGSFSEPSPDVAKQASGKLWKEMPWKEKARLFQEDRATYDALKAAAGE